MSRSRSADAVLRDLARWDLDGTEIAVIGLAGRFPGAHDVAELWQNLRRGVESIRHVAPDELAALGVPAADAADPRWVPAAAFLDDYDRFDAPFFDMGHREAEITDPQHRIALECSWAALEDAGYAPATVPGPAGVFLGATINTYLLLHLASRPELLAALEPVQINVGNGADFLATRVAYKLGLAGPAFTVQSACSTSLSAVHLACRSLFDEECDLALAGGVSVNLSLRGGYRAVEGSMVSPDGRCRPFDAAAQGTLFGSGAGVVVLRRLADALAAGDAVRAVLRGSAANNDGALKAGYTAPSVDGQARVISEALANAGVDPATVTYVEAHGTATPLGDPIEIAALTRAFRSQGSPRGSDIARRERCAVGSIKGNVGHLDAAAGVAGLIKTVLALEHREIPPTLHFSTPNPAIDFAAGPFTVPAALVPWESAGPRRAGVSAFGVGGTNVHVVLQEAPPALPRPAEAGKAQLLVLSARTPEALARARLALGSHLAGLSGLDAAGLADLAFTLQTGRAAWEHRWSAVAVSLAEARAALAEPAAGESGAGAGPVRRERRTAFLLPGQGHLEPGLCTGLYRAEPSFRRQLDRSAELLAPHLGGRDIRRLLDPPAAERAAAAAELARTEISQPVLFALEVALAQLWMDWGVRPDALLGHSLGELTAACLAGVLALPDALRVVAARGRLLEALPPGAMLAVPLGVEELLPGLDPRLALAAVNGPGRLVVAGPPEAVAELEQSLGAEGVATRRLPALRAFHSPAMAAAAGPFAELLGEVELRPPEIPLLSNLTGTWLTAAEATDPAYWGRHLHGTVRFGDGLTALLAGRERALLEVGPGGTLAQLARRHPHLPAGTPVVATFGGGGSGGDLPAEARPLVALGRLWAAGVEVDWPALHQGTERRRRPLPTYPFERHRYWIERRPTSAASPAIPEAGWTEPVPPPAAEQTPPAAEPERPAGPAATGGAHPRPALETPFVPPATALEQGIAEVWREALGLDRVGVLDSFFELGGDSLLAVQAADRLRLRLGREVPAAAFYEGVTVRALAGVLAAEEPAPAQTAAEELRRGEQVDRRDAYRRQRRERRLESELESEAEEPCAPS